MYFSFLYFKSVCHLYTYALVPYWGFCFFFLLLMMLNFFSVLVESKFLYSLFHEISICDFCPFYSWTVCFLRKLHIDTSSFFICVPYKSLCSQSSPCLFIFMSRTSQKKINFDEVKFISFLLIFVFVVKFKDSLHLPQPLIFYPIWFLKEILFCLWYLHLIHF